MPDFKVFAWKTSSLVGFALCSGPGPLAMPDLYLREPGIGARARASGPDLFGRMDSPKMHKTKVIIFCILGAFMKTKKMRDARTISLDLRSEAHW